MEELNEFEFEDYEPTDEELDEVELDLLLFDEDNYDAGYLDEEPWYLGREI